MYLASILFWNKNYIIIIGSVLLLSIYLFLSFKNINGILAFKFSYLLFFLILFFAPLNLYIDNELFNLSLKLLLMINSLTPILNLLLFKEKGKSVLYNIILNHIIFSFMLISSIK